MRLDLWGVGNVGLSGRGDLKGLRGRLGGGRLLRRGGRMRFEVETNLGCLIGIGLHIAYPVWDIFELYI